MEPSNGSGTIQARVWKLAVGRNTLLLLDSDVDGNAPEDRDLTARLYVDGINANDFRDRWGHIHARQLHPSCYDPEILHLLTIS